MRDDVQIGLCSLRNDSVANGQRMKCLTVAGDFSHECVEIGVDYGFSGEYVTHLLDRAARFRG